MNITNTMEWCSTKLEPQRPQSVIASEAKQSRCFGIRILNYGDRIAPGKYQLHSRFQRAVNFLHEYNLVSFVTPSIGFGPYNIVVNDIDLFDVDTITIEYSYLMLDTIIVDYSTIPHYDSTLQVPASIDFKKLQSNVLYFKKIIKKLASIKSLVFLLNEKPEISAKNTFEKILQERFIAGTNLINQGIILEGIALIHGLGIGLTPSGDDFIAGLLIALNIQQIMYQNQQRIPCCVDATEEKSDEAISFGIASQKPLAMTIGHHISALIEDVFKIAQNSNPLSTAFLRNAKDGRVFDKLKHTISALFAFEPNELLTPTLDLLSVGATSGADIAIGLIYGLEKFRPYGS